MTTRSGPVLAGISRRTAEDHDLLHLLAEVRSARAANQVTRGAPRRGSAPSSDASRLAASLTAYARALESYRLPVPPAIRDELRLLRAIP
ncbi:hypothetical protein E0H73_32500 [Kribbella pittospori]|uniref:Uncharacterized protein n=1 Tax=Kribbella pittospori TaxID=722689 RepID=A0A4R0KA45_9ACTN|nr:hypothetical protein [Kribbella pittospori]TCC56410.1 hypothetical protein E0H73_32500 [Kribbella pittospori]